MDAHPTQPDSAAPPASPLQARRNRMQALVAAQRQRLGQLETQILERLDHANEALAREREALGARVAEWERRQQETDARAGDLAKREADLFRRQAELDSQADQLETNQIKLRAQQQALAAELDARTLELDRLQQRATEQLAQVDADRQALEESRAQLDEKIAELARQETNLRRRQVELDERAQELTSAVESFAQRQAEARQELDGERAELASRRTELDAASAKCRQEQCALADEQTAAAGENDRLQRRWTEQLATLDREQAELTAEWERTAAQRRNIAEALKRQRTAQTEAIQVRLAEIDALHVQANTGHEALLADVRRECQRLGDRLNARGEELQSEVAAHEAARSELARVKSQLEQALRDSEENAARASRSAADCAAAQSHAARLASECDELRAGWEREDHSATEPSLADAATRELVEQLTAERNDLARRLALAEEMSGDVGPREDDESGADHSHELADLTRRYEMAVRDIRELKKQNESLSRNAGGGNSVTAAASPALDWESRKRQLLESLEQDEDGEGDQDRQAERVQIEDVICRTDSTVREQQHEIEELKRLVAQRDDVPAPATSEPSAHDIAEQDEIVRQQRERLKQLETEWEEKLRQAEVELSVERAKLARTGAEMEERKRALDEQSAHQSNQLGTGEGSGKSKKGGRGRWLSRLGLADDDK